MPFTGTYDRSLDEKQRLPVPKQLRDELAKESSSCVLYITPGTDGSLAIYSEKAFQEYAQMLSRLSANDPHVRTYMRLYYSQAEQVEMDKQGRIRVPDRLMKLARLEHEVVLLGVHQHIELWDKGLWEQFLTKNQSEFDQFASQLQAVPMPPVLSTPAVG